MWSGRVGNLALFANLDFCTDTEAEEGTNYYNDIEFVRGAPVSTPVSARVRACCGDLIFVMAKLATCWCWCWSSLNAA
jgi:hypothetical protein